MQIDDNYIKREFQKSTGSINTYRLKKATDEELEFLQNRYTDSFSIKETLIRIFKGYDIHPTCPICGKYLQLNGHVWRKYCSRSCNSKATAKMLEEKYGVRSTLRLPENQEKVKQTCLEHWGVDNVLKSKEIRERSKESNKEKYGVEYNSQREDVKEKVKQTCLEKYGTEHYFNSQDCKEKTIIALGEDNYRKTETCKVKHKIYVNEHKQELSEKRKQTCLERYGVDNPLKYDEFKEKSKQTCLERYGSEHWSQSKEGKMRSLEISSRPEIKEKIYKTKKKNNSFHISKKEDETYLLLIKLYPYTKRQYKSEKYPFCCDFYIPDIDLYIECNYHWSHGKHPYDATNDKDQKLAQIWKNKNTQYYDNALKVWTEKDVQKRTIAKQNNLNYIEFFSIDEFMNWINKKENTFC